MKQHTKALFAGGVLACVVVGAAMAGPLEDGVVAQEKGNYARALQLLQPLAEQGNAFAPTAIGGMYQEGQGVVQSNAQAFAWYQKAAGQGDPFAETFLGGMYIGGEGVAQSYERGAAWYLKAAEQGVDVAQFKLAGLYYKGNGVPQDYVQGHMWLNLTASHTGDAEMRGKAAKARDQLAIFMTLDQVAEAQKMARKWKPMLRQAPGPPCLEDPHPREGCLE